MIPVFINQIPARGLIDTGADCSLMSERFYRKISKGVKNREKKFTPRKILMANATPLKILLETDVEIKINGLQIPFALCVIKDLSYDVILGLNFLQETQAVVDVPKNSLILFQGLLTIPMTVTGAAPVVTTIATVMIPPLCEAVFPVKTNRKLKNGTYVIEGELQSPCRGLVVARVLVNPAKVMTCRAMNTTDKPIKLNPYAPVGVLTEVTIPEQIKSKQTDIEQLPTIAEMRQTLEKLDISVKDTAVTGQDFENLIKLLYRNKDLIATDLNDLPGTDVLMHKIDTGSHPPIKKRSYRHAPADREEIARQVNEMYKANIIERSDSPWSSPVLLVSKKDGTRRFCIDYRNLNSVSTMSSWPLPTLDEVIDTIANEKPVLWSSLDLKSGYWQAKVEPMSRDRTAFEADGQNWQFVRVPFGLTGAPQFFQRLMSKVLQKLSTKTLLLYIDDILVMSRSPDEMNCRLQEIFDRFREANLRIHPAKCHWSVDRVKFLGHIWDVNGISVDSDKISIVRDFPRPDTPKKVKSFLGLANYYRRFILGFSILSAPLRGLLAKDKPFIWNANCERAFLDLKTALTTAPVLALPQLNKPYILTTDACSSGLAYILSQKDAEGSEHVICYGGRGLRSHETRYGVTDLEALAVIEGIKQYHTYLIHNPFELVTDHISLKYLQTMKLSGLGRLTRWAMFLQPYRFTVRYKQGALLTSADAISRIPREQPQGEELQTKDRENSESDDVCRLAVAESEQKPPKKERINIDFIFEGEDASVNVLSIAELPTTDDFKTELSNCPDFSRILNYLNNGELPQEEQKARNVVFEAENFVVDNGLLYHLFTPRTKKMDRIYPVMKQLCVPAGLREHIACGLHDRNGHIGFDRLYATARTRYFWYGMYVFLKEHVRTCLACQKTKTFVKPGEVPITSLEVPPVAQRWHLDHHGPYPTSQGCNHILVLIDSTSLWCELIPTPSTDAETVIEEIFNNIVARHGLPRGISILTDNGAAFTSRLSAAFCKHFGIKQLFSTPYHHCTNARAEAIGDVIHKSLRTLVKDQKDWAKHLQATALAYRASATSSIGLSPYEIMFGRKMQLQIDWNLLPDEQTVGTPEAYAEIIRPKLEILNRIAMENAKESARKQADTQHQKSVTPTYKLGDKVLLHDPVTRRGDSSKLRPLYKGPYYVIDTQPGFNYRLKEIATGKEMKRMVHASRLRPLREHPNDYRDSNKNTDISLFQGVSKNREIVIHVTVGDIIESQADVIACLHGSQHDHDTGVAHAIAEAAGPDMITAWQNITATPLPDEFLVEFTPAGRLNPPIKSILHIKEPTSCKHSLNQKSLLPQQTLQATVYHCLVSADHRQAKSITIPVVKHKERCIGPWEIAQALADAIKQFDIDSKGSPVKYLERVEIISLTLDIADVTSFVFTDYFNKKSPETVEVLSPHSEDEWFEIEGLLKHRRKKGKDEYLVQWKGTDEKTWQKREDITDVAIKEFYANKPRRR